MSLIIDWLLRCHSCEACGGQHTSLTTDYACSWDRTNRGGNIPDTVCYVHSAACTFVLCVLSHWTLGEAAYPSKNLAMSLRRHTKVLANGKG